MTGGTVGIVGIGLIGGSIARDLSASGVRVLAVERDTVTVRRALDAGAIADGGPGIERLEAADVVILATPPTIARGLLADLAPRLKHARWITDVASTKRSIVDAAEAAGVGARFVGSHPLAGGTDTGFRASRSGLFVDAPVYLCPTPTTTDEALEAVSRFWTALGARPLRMPADAHDRRLAWASQLPQLAASLLAVAMSRAGVEAGMLGPGGRDTTRLAASSPDLWTDIAADDPALLAATLGEYARLLGEAHDALERMEREAAAQGDEAVGPRDGGPAGPEALRALLAEARAWAIRGDAAAAGSAAGPAPGSNAS